MSDDNSDSERSSIEQTDQVGNAFPNGSNPETDPILLTDGGQDNAKVVGYNTAASGETVGVFGRVDSDSGYGFQTPGDVKVDGSLDTLDAFRVLINGNDNISQMADQADTAAAGVILGHSSNTIDTSSGATAATVSGGQNNTAGSDNTTVSGGNDNKAISPGATVSGGINNEAAGVWSTVAGGISNRTTVDADRSFVAGSGAIAAHGGSFVFSDVTEQSDGQNIRFKTSTSGGGPTGEDTFQVRSTGGVRFATSVVTDATANNTGEVDAGMYVSAGGSSWNSVSARSAKHDIAPVDPQAVLTELEDIEISTWTYDSQAEEDNTHMGPMAGSFYEAFDLGEDPETIGHVDADGVAFAAIQGLSATLDETRDELAETQTELADAHEELAAKEGRIDEVESRLSALEAHLDTNPTVTGD